MSWIRYGINCVNVILKEAIENIVTIMCDILNVTKLSCVISDLWSFQLAAIGILVSVATLLYASLSSKTEAKQITDASKTLEAKNHSVGLGNAIKQLQKLNVAVVKQIRNFGILFVCTTIFRYVNYCHLLLSILFAILISVTLLVSYHTVKTLYETFNYYRHEAE